MREASAGVLERKRKKTVAVENQSNIHSFTATNSIFPLFSPHLHLLPTTYVATYVLCGHITPGTGTVSYPYPGPVL